MSRTLVITTIAGLAVCGLSLGAAALVGGDDIFHDPRSLEGVKPLIDLATHKAWHWNGGDTLALDAPINIRYQQQGAPQVSVTGPAEAIEHVRVSEGRIAADTSLSRKSGRKVEAVVTGIPIRKFVVNGGEHLDLGEVKQPDLDLHINGNGTITGSGEVDRLKLTVAGPGNAALGGLSVTADAKVAILGNGVVALAPIGDVRLFIAGNGRLDMASKPRSISQTIIGHGEIEQISAAAAAEGTEAARAATREALRNVPAIIAAATEAARAATREALQNIPAPPVPPAPPASFPDGTHMSGDRLTVRGNRNVDLGHIEQTNLKVTVLDSGSVAADGKVDTLSVEVMGSGNVNLGRLAAREVRVTIAGSGDVTVAPSDALKVTIMGSGDVHLMTRPPRVEQQIMGSGHIIEAR
jgi:hypothetical protein